MIDTVNRIDKRLDHDHNQMNETIHTQRVQEIKNAKEVCMVSNFINK